MTLSERIQFQEAIKYGQTLKGANVLQVITVDELPQSIPAIISEIIRISSVPTARLANTASDEELSLWVTSFFEESLENKTFFKPNEIFWRFWFVISITDFNYFVKNYLSGSSSKDFYLADVSGKRVQALLNEEYNYELFIH